IVLPVAGCGYIPGVERRSHMAQIAFMTSQAGVENVELQGPWQAVTEAGHNAVLLAPQRSTAQSMRGDLDKDATIPADPAISDARGQDYAMLVIPGGNGQCGPVAARQAGGGPRASVRQRPAADCGHLPRSVDAGRSGSRARYNADLVPVLAHRCSKRRRRVGGRTSEALHGRRLAAGDLAWARRRGCGYR